MALSNKRAEAWIIGALLDGESGATGFSAEHLIAASSLTAEDFYSEAARNTFGAIEACIKSDIFPSFSNVVAKTTPGKESIEVDGLVSLKNSNVLSFGEFMIQAEELKRLSRLRQSQKFLQEQKITEATRPEELASQFESYAEALSTRQNTDEVATVDLQELCTTWAQNIENNASPFIATGVEVLDEVIRGFVPNLNVIGGLPSVGKSALIAEIVYNILSRGIPCGFFGLEDATAWIPKRHIARQMKIKVWEVGFRRLNLNEQGLLAAATEQIQKRLQYMTVYRRAGITADELVAKARSWIVTRGVKCIFIDHGGEIQHGTNIKDRHDLAVANTYRALRDMAINYKVPVVVLAHFNRATGDGMPTMRSFAESEYIARMARLALGLWREPSTDALLCTVLKQTEGKRGDTLELKVDVDAALVSSKGGSFVSPVELGKLNAKAN